VDPESNEYLVTGMINVMLCYRNVSVFHNN
jgi:hypothetical protein